MNDRKTALKPVSLLLTGALVASLLLAPGALAAPADDGATTWGSTARQLWAGVDAFWEQATDTAAGWFLAPADEDDGSEPDATLPYRSRDDGTTETSAGLDPVGAA